MSGNSTHFGMSLALAHWREVLAAGVIIGCFVGGASLGTLVADASNRFEIVAVLHGECLIFLLAFMLAADGHNRAALVLIALAMGMQNTLHQMVAGADVGKGFITGVLIALGQSLARWVRG